MRDEPRLAGWRLSHSLEGHEGGGKGARGAAKDEGEVHGR
jgi:hypothetical protein